MNRLEDIEVAFRDICPLTNRLWWVEAETTVECIAHT